MCIRLEEEEDISRIDLTQKYVILAANWISTFKTTPQNESPTWSFSPMFPS